MRKQLLLIFVMLMPVTLTLASVGAPAQIAVAPGTISATTATLIWLKPEQYDNVTRYHVMLNGKDIAISPKCNYTFQNLKPGTNYSCTIKAEDKTGALSSPGSLVTFATKQTGKLLDVIAYGAKADGTTLNTKAIQKAIDACPAGGTVLIPKGIFLSGALFLKSHMTLQIAKNGVLKGSTNESDYRPFIRNRFEGWEMDTYASLLNAGVMNNKGGYSVEDLSIKGEGTISGGDSILGNTMIAKHGFRTRGRLICLMNCRNVEVQGLTVERSPCWTIHYIYSKDITCHDLTINSTVWNGDGLDPDSSEDCYIFNCSFNTGDDCIAIKSGKNPEGFTIGKPTKNVRITDCNFIGGSGISIGSEMSGGVSDILVQDCKTGTLLHGLQIKGTKDRGGYIKNVQVLDCQLLKITIFSELEYNNDGAAAPEIPMFSNFTFKNIDMSAASVKEPVMNLNGFKAAAHKLHNCSFTNISLPENASIVINDAKDLHFINVKSVTGKKPAYKTVNCDNITK